MKLNKLKLSLLSILILVIVGCKKEDQCQKHTGINGEWIWVESVGGFGGWTITPESEKLTRKLGIDDFFYKEFVNDSLVLETEYDLGMFTSTAAHRTVIAYLNVKCFSYAINGRFFSMRAHL